jgi:hypothetical protein
MRTRLFTALVTLCTFTPSWARAQDTGPQEDEKFGGPRYSDCPDSVVESTVLDFVHASYLGLPMSKFGGTFNTVSVEGRDEHLVFLAGATIPVPIPFYTRGKNPLCPDSSFFSLTYLPDFTVNLRMLNTTSSPVPAPSYKPTIARVQLLWQNRWFKSNNSNDDPKVPTGGHIFGVTLTGWSHHSNGSRNNSPFFQEDLIGDDGEPLRDENDQVRRFDLCGDSCTSGDFNERDGGFATNYSGFTVHYLREWAFNNVTGDYRPLSTLYWHIEYQFHHGGFVGGLTPELKPLWGNHRSLAEVDFRRRFPSRDDYVSVRLAGEVSLDCFLFMAEEERPDACARIEAETSYFPVGDGQIGAYTRVRFGQDPYNILFTNNLAMIDFGLTVDTSRSLFDWPALTDPVPRPSVD